MSEFSKPKVPEKIYKVKPPSVEEALVKVYKKWREKNESEHIPKDYLGGAAWWIQHQEGQGEHEAPIAAFDHKGNQNWHTPYLHRLVISLRSFLEFSEAEKAYVIHHIDLGVAYRGDSIDFYKQVVEQTGFFKRDPEEFKTNARSHLV